MGVPKEGTAPRGQDLHAVDILPLAACVRAHPGCVPSERRRKWEVALIKGYTYIAGHDLRRCTTSRPFTPWGCTGGQLSTARSGAGQAADFMHKVAEVQDPGASGRRTTGPSYAYNFVYSDVWARTRGLEGPVVLAALERASRFHSSFTYPDGSIVETVDERNPYHTTVRPGNVGFSFTPAGRGYLSGSGS